MLLGQRNGLSGQRPDQGRRWGSEGTGLTKKGEGDPAHGQSFCRKEAAGSCCGLESLGVWTMHSWLVAHFPSAQDEVESRNVAAVRDDERRLVALAVPSVHRGLNAGIGLAFSGRPAQKEHGEVTPLRFQRFRIGDTMSTGRPAMARPSSLSRFSARSGQPTTAIGTLREASSGQAFPAADRGIGSTGWPKWASGLFPDRRNPGRPREHLVPHDASPGSPPWRRGPEAKRHRSGNSKRKDAT